MAATPVDIPMGIPDRVDLVLELYARGTDVLANGGGDALMEQTNRVGVYRAVVDEPLVGVFEAYVVDADGDPWFVGAVELADDTNVYTVGELGDVPVASRASRAEYTGQRAAYLDNLNGHVPQSGDVFAELPVNFGLLAIDPTGRIVVGDISVAALERFVTQDTGHVAAAPGSVARLSQATTVVLSVPAAQLAAVLAGSTITLYRGDTLAIAISGLGNVANRTQLWFTGKNKSGDADSAAQLQVEETDGLLVLAGATPVVDETASISVDDEIAGNLTIAVSAAAAKKLVPTTTGVWDVQMRDADGNVVTLAHGALKVVADVTQRIE